VFKTNKDTVVVSSDASLKKSEIQSYKDKTLEICDDKDKLIKRLIDEIGIE